ASNAEQRLFAGWRKLPALGRKVSLSRGSFPLRAGSFLLVAVASRSGQKTFSNLR
ncbi:MAG: hypothetical protein ACI93S_001133, partial [Ancylomarina sp.]